MKIGEVARRAGVSTRALRYYEEHGLLSAERTTSGQRVYAESAVERVQMIQQFFTAGLPSRTIRQLMPCVDTGQGSSEVFEMLAAERVRITSAMADLAAARDALDGIVAMAQHPTPEHCPALRETPWAPFEGAGGPGATMSEGGDPRGPAAELARDSATGPDR